MSVEKVARAIDSFRHCDFIEIANRVISFFWMDIKLSDRLKTSRVTSLSYCISSLKCNYFECYTNKFKNRYQICRLMCHISMSHKIVRSSTRPSRFRVSSHLPTLSRSEKTFIVKDARAEKVAWDDAPHIFSYDLTDWSAQGDSASTSLVTHLYPPYQWLLWSLGILNTFSIM